MRPQTLISVLYGEARGYHRLAIRRQVAANERISRTLLLNMAEQLFQHHVRRSIARFPFYADHVKAHRGSLPRPGELVRPEELPIWTRRHQTEFFAQQKPPSEWHYVHETGGSTGHVVRFYITRESYEWRTAIGDRVYSWAGAEEGARSLHIWGVGRKPKPWSHGVKRAVHVALQRRRYFNAYREFTDEDRAACCKVINRMRPRAIVGYTGVLVDIARYARDHDALRWKAPTLISTAETLQCGQRELLQAHLAREVFDSYGSREFMNIGTECVMHAGYHLTADNLRVEVVDDAGNPVSPGEAGRVVVTDFHNAATPFIRYEVGDFGAMAPPEETCLCGKPFPFLRSVEGRVQDVIYTPTGRVSALNITNAIEIQDWIEGYQVVQQSRDRILIRVLTPAELTEERRGAVTNLLRDALGGMAVDFERATELSRRPNGKVEVVVSKLEEPVTV